MQTMLTSFVAESTPVTDRNPFRFANASFVPWDEDRDDTGWSLQPFSEYLYGRGGADVYISHSLGRSKVSWRTKMPDSCSKCHSGRLRWLLLRSSRSLEVPWKQDQLCIQLWHVLVSLLGLEQQQEDSPTRISQCARRWLVALGWLNTCIGTSLLTSSALAMRYGSFQNASHSKKEENFLRMGVAACKRDRAEVQLPK